MSAAAAPPHSDGEDEEEYRRPSKRLKTAARQTEEREEGEDELEEGEDSDSGSLPGEGEAAVDHRARWSSSQYRGGRKVGTDDWRRGRGSQKVTFWSRPAAFHSLLMRLRPKG